MTYLLFITGLLCTIITIYDMIYTILAPRGAGFIADRISRKVWRFALTLASHDGRSKMLRFIGPLNLLFILLTWIILLWLSNTLMVYSDPHSLWSSSDNEYVQGFVESLYFTSYVLSSMGSGDYTPASDWWLIYTGFISYTGVVFISLGISFLLPVIEAIILKRKVSVIINGLGKNPKQILNNYKHENFKSFCQKLEDLEPELIKLAQNHLAYPVIHYFHSENLYESLSVQLVTLDETMSVILYKIKDENIENRLVVERCYKAMTYYLSTLAAAFIEPQDDEPERPNTDYLNDISKSDAALSNSDDTSLSDRRKLLLAYLQNDGWSWDYIEKEKDEIQLKK